MPVYEGLLLEMQGQGQAGKPATQLAFQCFRVSGLVRAKTLLFTPAEQSR